MAMSYTLHLGDCRTVLATLDDNSVDSIVTDPPYELGFMGKTWDSTGIAYDVTVWTECLRVLKPGGHLLAFGGSRTYHRMAVAIEDAGFDIRDQIMWIYGSGFPKSLNIGKAMDKQAGAVREVVSIQKGTLPTAGRENWKNLYDRGDGKTPEGRDYNAIIKRREKIETEGIAITAPATDNAKTWDGWGTALKPAHEPICVARKPLRGTVVDNVLAYGVGGINIDGCRVNGLAWYRKDEVMKFKGPFLQMKPIARRDMHTAGRWPANIIFDEAAGQILDEQSGHSVSSDRVIKMGTAALFGNGKPCTGKGHADSGGASRFFYTAKAHRSEREAGLSGMAKIKQRNMAGQQRKDGTFQEWMSEPLPRANHHPTVKPLDLMQYLVRLVTPKGGTVLDPFLGSGSTGCAAVLEGFDFIGIDITPEYIDIATKRLVYYSCESPLDGV